MITWLAVVFGRSYDEVQAWGGLGQNTKYDYMCVCVCDTYISVSIIIKVNNENYFLKYLLSLLIV